MQDIAVDFAHIADLWQQHYIKFKNTIFLKLLLKIISNHFALQCSTGKHSHCHRVDFK